MRLERCRVTRRYRVVDSAGMQVGSWQASPDQAWTAAENAARPTGQARPCMRCGKIFQSSGPGERLCSAACRTPDISEPFHVSI